VADFVGKWRKFGHLPAPRKPPYRFAVSTIGLGPPAGAILTASANPITGDIRGEGRGWTLQTYPETPAIPEAAITRKKTLCESFGAMESKSWARDRTNREGKQNTAAGRGPDTPPKHIDCAVGGGSQIHGGSVPSFRKGAGGQPRWSGPPRGIDQRAPGFFKSHSHGGT